MDLRGRVCTIAKHLEFEPEDPLSIPEPPVGVDMESEPDDSLCTLGSGFVVVGLGAGDRSLWFITWILCRLSPN